MNDIQRWLLVGLDGQIAAAGACCIIAFVTFVRGVVINTLFKAGAEIIRLLKKSNGLKFIGEISQPTAQQDTRRYCSACGEFVYRSQTKCPGCGAEFEI